MTCYVKFLLGMFLTLTLASCEDSGSQSKAKERIRSSAEARPTFERQSLAVGRLHSCAVTKDKKVLCWGGNINGHLGNNSTTSTSYPVYVVDGDNSTNHLTNIVEVAAGSDHTCALKSSGEVLCWGVGDSGRLGNGETLAKDHPVLVKMQNADSSLSNLSNIVQITVGEAHTCALKSSGKVLCWGYNAQGQLGNGVSADNPPNQSYPVYVHQSENSSNHLTGIVQVRVGQRHTCALSSTGRGYCWGQGVNGQLGSSSEKVWIPGDGVHVGVERHTPLVILTEEGGTPLGDILEITPGGAAHSCALLGNHSVKCWGNSNQGRLGNGVTANETNYFPLDVLAANEGSGNLSDIVKLFSGNRHSCALQSTGTVVCWGYGSEGRIGNGADSNQGSPVSVIGGRSSSANFSGMIDLARGAIASHICVQNAEGKILCWGRADYGQLGDNITTSVNTGLSHPVTVIAGDGSTEALGSISTFRRTYSCVDGGSSCRADSVVLSIDGASVGNTGSVTVKVSGLTDVQTLELYDGGDCSSRVGILDGSADPQEIAVSSLSESLHKFHFMVIEGNDEIVPCSKKYDLLCVRQYCPGRASSFGSQCFGNCYVCRGYRECY